MQMWVRPDTERLDPGYEQLDVNAELDRGGLVPIASGRGHDAAIAIRQRGAVLWGGRLRAGETVAVPDARHAHVFVAAGRVVMEGDGADRARRPATRCASPRRVRRGWSSAQPTGIRRSGRCRGAHLGDGRDGMTTILVATTAGLYRIVQWPELLHIEPILDVAGEYVLVAGYGVQKGFDYTGEYIEVPGATCLLWTGSELFAGTQGAHLVRVGLDGRGNQPVTAFDAVAGRDQLVPAPRRPALGPHHGRRRRGADVRQRPRGRHRPLRRRRPLVGADHRHRHRRPPGGDGARPPRPRRRRHRPGDGVQRGLRRDVEDRRRRALRQVRPGGGGGGGHRCSCRRRRARAGRRRPSTGGRSTAPAASGSAGAGSPRRSPATSTRAASPPRASSSWSAPPTAASSGRRTPGCKWQQITTGLPPVTRIRILD